MNYIYKAPSTGLVHRILNKYQLLLLVSFSHFHAPLLPSVTAIQRKPENWTSRRLRENSVSALPSDLSHGGKPLLCSTSLHSSPTLTQAPRLDLDQQY